MNISVDVCLLSVCLFLCLSVCLFVCCVFVCVCLSFCLFVCLSFVCLSCLLCLMIDLLENFKKLLSNHGDLDRLFDFDIQGQVH